MKVKNLLILFLSFLPLLASADPVEVNGIYYNLLEKNQAEVTHGPSNTAYSGDVIIPATLTYSGQQYNVVKIGREAFNNNTKVTSVVIPAGVTSIDMYAFLDCRNMLSVVIPNGVTSIGFGAFMNCEALDDVIIPSSVKTIGSKAFEGCDDLINLYCYATTPPTAESNTFEDMKWITLHVRANMKEAYAAVEPWSKFGKIVEQCATPTISYANNKLSFSCEIADAEFEYTITDDDVTSGTGSEVELAVTYNISVYAKNANYDKSEAATATLCWVDQSPEFTNISDAEEITAAPVLIQSYGGIVTVQGAADGTPVNIYTTAGTQAGSTVSQHSMARINTNMQPGTIAIIKIGDKSVKTVVK